MNTRDAQHLLMKTTRFGIEIEVIGIGRERATEAIARTMEVSRVHCCGRRVSDHRGRVWKCVTDSSLSDQDSGTEVVSPPLLWDDIPMLQEIIRSLKLAGARVDHSCGIHIHIDGAGFKADPAAIARLIKITYQQEDIMMESFRMHLNRQQYAGTINPRLLEKIRNMRQPSWDNVKRAWYNGAPSDMRYHASRYKGVNLHALFTDRTRTVEFRYFNATLHAGKVKAYIQFCLALAAKALLAKGAHARKRVVKHDNYKYAMRIWMNRLGLVGDEFKVCRLHMLKLLPGNSAWSNPETRRAA